MMSFLATLPAFAQEEDISGYFSDAQKYPTLVIKCDPVLLIHGDLAGFVEVNLGQRIALEGSLGILLPYYLPELIDIFDDKLTNIKGGVSYSASARLYSKKRKAPEGFYGFTTFRQRKYLTDGEYNLNNKDFILGWGYQFIPQNFVTADLYYGIGGRVKKFNYNDTRETDMGGAAIFLIGVRIGFKII